MATESAIVEHRLSPENLFQVIINDEGVTPTPLSAIVQRNVDALKATYPAAKHFLLNDREIRDFLGANFSSELCTAYDRLAPFAYKSDLARYCLLLVHGGLYCDIGVRFLQQLTAPAWAGLAAFRDVCPSSARLLCVQNAVILAVPRRPELKIAVDIIVENCARLHYGASPLDPTGPVVFGRAILGHNDVGSCFLGDYREVSPEQPVRKNPVYVTPEGVLVALGKGGKGGDLTAFGLGGVNNYNDFWHDRCVYGEKDPTRWGFDAPQINSQTGTKTAFGIEFDTGSQGYVVYGPYASIAPGKYDVVMKFDPKTELDDAHVDVVAFAGRETIKQMEPDELELDAEGRLSFGFTAQHRLSQLEVRLHVRGASRGRFESLSVIGR